MSDLNKAFRENLASVMERKNISRSELARLMGRSPAYVTQVFTVERNVGLQLVEQFAEALSVDPLSLLKRTRVKAA